jgi:hypothetical protein
MSLLQWGGSTFSTLTKSRSGRSIHELKQTLHDAVEFGLKDIILETLTELVSFYELLEVDNLKGRHPKVIFTEILTCILHILIVHSLSFLDYWWCKRIFFIWGLWRDDAGEKINVDAVLYFAHMIGVYFSRFNHNFRLVESIMSTHYEIDLNRINKSFEIEWKSISNPNEENTNEYLQYELKECLRHESLHIKYQALYYGLKLIEKDFCDVAWLALKDYCSLLLIDVDGIEIWSYIFYLFKLKPCHSTAKVKTIHKEKVNDPKRYQLLCYTQAFLYVVEANIVELNCWEKEYNEVEDKLKDQDWKKEMEIQEPNRHLILEALKNNKQNKTLDVTYTLFEVDWRKEANLIQSHRNIRKALYI